uniref:Cytohesin 1 n=1 Tax=Taeniopygia guttata TaxID=59729 RepID=A0A674GX48_TAEGU
MVLRAEGSVPSDLTPEECQELENIRRRKQELLADIQRLKDEIAEVTNEIENLGSTEERKNMQRNKQVAMGRKKFNMDPKKGIQFLIENDLLKNTCEDIAQFLYKGEGLNKTAIGDYLGERDEFNIQVLHAFVELHEFTDLNLVQALRQFLWSFRLPGEAQKIDRMMEAFAQRYCQCNPGVFQSTDTCYVLSFAIIMLNTSLHNPNVKDKPTAERFIAMNRGINDGGDLPEELLQNLYESIKNEPFKIPEDDGNDLTHTFFNPDREGWLLKLAGGRVKTWKRRWFILTDNCLYYFEYTTDKEPRGIIPLENLSIREVEDSKKPVSAVAVSCGVWGQLWLGQEKLRGFVALRCLQEWQGAPGQSLPSSKALVTTGAHAGPGGGNHVVCLSLSAVLGWLCQGCMALLFPSQSGVPFRNGG